MVRALGLILVLTAACGNITRKSDGDAGPSDGKMIDSPDIVPGDAMQDAGIDAPPTPPQSREIVNGVGRMSSATYTFEVQIGNAVSQKQAAGATYRIEGNASVKP